LTSAETDQPTKLAALPEEEIDLQDIPEAPAESWRHTLRGVVRVDRDLLKWFEQHAGRDYPSRNKPCAAALHHQALALPRD
jgi:hypothetical protein